MLHLHSNPSSLPCTSLLLPPLTSASSLAHLRDRSIAANPSPHSSPLRAARDIFRNAVAQGFKVSSLSRRGVNPEPEDELLQQVKWVAGDALDPAVVKVRAAATLWAVVGRRGTERAAEAARPPSIVNCSHSPISFSPLASADRSPSCLSPSLCASTKPFSLLPSALAAAARR
eukprot:scaffold7866_cov31-Tisochrysis_lutea.AAC.1